MLKNNKLKWVDYQPKHTKAPVTIYCLPYAGAGSLMYRPWSLIDPDKIKVKGLLLPGRESKFKEPLYTDYQVLLDDLFESFIQENPQNYYIFGYSLGALLAYDLTTKLHLAKLKLPKTLFVAAMSAPDKIIKPIRYDEYSDNELANLLIKEQGLDYNDKQIIQLQKLLLPTVRQDHLFYENYQPFEKIKLPIPIKIFAGEKDLEHPKESVNNWQNFTTEPIETTWYNNGHLFFKKYYQDIFDSNFR